MSSFFDQNILFAVERSQRGLRRRVESELTASGSRLTVPQSMLLAFIEENPGLSQKDAADHLLTDVMNVSRMIRELAARGLVVRERDPADQRAFQVVLTQLGRNELADVRRHMTRIRRELAARLGQGNRDTLMSLLEEITSWSRNEPAQAPRPATAPTVVDRVGSKRS